MAFLGQQEQVRELQDRFRYLYMIAFVGLSLLLARLVYLQILVGDKMRTFSEENRIKRVKVAAPRGMIFDRNRKLLIDNRPAFDLEIIPQYLRESKQAKNVTTLLAKLIHMPESEIQETLERSDSQPSFMPVKIKTDLTRDEVASIESWRIMMPGVEVKEEIKRTNVYGDVASHLLGYIGEVNTSELPQLTKKGLNYKLGDTIGKFGLEQRLEDVLRGSDGEEIKEVDALGRVKLDKGKARVLDINPGREAVPGKNLVLTIDQDLQIAATKAFGEKIGALTAINPKTGEVLAMISRPSFDPTDFSRGIPATIWNALLSNENQPLHDKTISDHYPPGSTFKIITAIAGLEEGVIDENTRIPCPGFIRVGNHAYRCWNRHGHGSLNVVEAIAQSCDVFFYRVAQRLKSVDDIAKWAFHLGLGKKTGVPLSHEVPGLIPTEEWKRRRFNQLWNGGETVSVAVGQSFVLATALQLANSYASIANGGTLFRPFLVKEIESYDGKVLKTFEPEVVEHVNLHPKTIELIKKGLWNAVNGAHGTAHSIRLPGMDMVGKTGTAQVIGIKGDKIYEKCTNLKFRDRHHGLFVAFAPANDPVIAAAAVAEHSCHGVSGAGPIVRAVIKTYLQKYYPDLYGEHILAERLKAAGDPDARPLKSESEVSSPPEDEVILDDDASSREKSAQGD